jgi:hypothetical protein
VCLLFVVYDFLVERRQLHAVESAAKSNALIRSLFPATFRDRLLKNSTESSRANEFSGNLRGKRSAQITGVPACLVSTSSDISFFLSPKLRLTKFLNAPGEAMDSTANLSLEDEPIAEMFSNTTVVCMNATTEFM